MSTNAVEIHDLSFRYQGASELALKKVNLTVRKGEITLLVGATGAGSC